MPTEACGAASGVTRGARVAVGAATAAGGTAESDAGAAATRGDGPDETAMTMAMRIAVPMAAPMASTRPRDGRGTSRSPSL